MIDRKSIFSIKNATEFETLALQVFKFQFENNPVYRSFCDLLFVHPSDIEQITQIPFLPIEFFKTHHILSSDKPIKKVFKSSGTTSASTSKHYVTDLNIYKDSFTKGFETFYGNISSYIILALLPSYLERKNASLVYMIKSMIEQSKHKDSGFYLNNLSQLKDMLVRLDAEGNKILLLGVSFGLLDLVETFQFKLKNTIIMETGGMKGRRKELIREELHERLKQGFGVDVIHSEYGMTELLSQAYSKGKGVFRSPNWVKIITRDTEDALTTLPTGKAGGINVIDLANINSCSFIATQDLGRVFNDGSFEIIGRFDNSDIRGCNLMVL